METFKIGDKVKWTSQSGGFTRTKEGLIVRILIGESPTPPYVVANREFPKHKRMFDGTRIPGTTPNNEKNAVGYLVEVRDGKTSKAMPKLYMPYPNKITAA